MLQKNGKNIRALFSCPVVSSRGMDKYWFVLYYQRNCSTDKTSEIAMASLFSRKKTTPLDRRRSLASVPVLNEGVSCREGDASRIIITIRQRRRPGFMGRFQPDILERTVKLDELGGFVFRQIDNHKKTSEIIDAFRDRYQINRREATLSTVEFLKSLVKRGVISIAVK